VGIAVIHGEFKCSEADEVDGRNSPPPEMKNRIMDVTVGAPAPFKKEKPPLTSKTFQFVRFLVFEISKLMHQIFRIFHFRSVHQYFSELFRLPAGFSSKFS